MANLLLFISLLTFHARKRYVLRYIDTKLLTIYLRRLRKPVSKHYMDLPFVEEQCIGCLAKHAEKRILEERVS